MSASRRRRNPGPPQGPGHYSADGQQWFDEAGKRWLPVRDEQDTLVIELEDVNAASWWASILATLASQSGHAYSRFVGHATGTHPRWTEYTVPGPTFPRVRGIPDTMTPQESWAPGMNEALQQLRCRLQAEGWHEVDHGDKPWAYIYARPRLLWPPD